MMNERFSESSVVFVDQKKRIQPIVPSIFFLDEV